MVYHFDVYLPRDSTVATALDTLNFALAVDRFYHFEEYWPHDSTTGLLHVSSSSASSVPDGAWREPSPPPRLSTFVNEPFRSKCCRPPSVPMDEYESILHLPQLDLILEVRTMVRIALQIPMPSMSRSRHTVTSRYELHRCRHTSM